MISILERFYDPVTGHINMNVNGVYIDSMNPWLFREYVALVQQGPVLYPGTIRHNISMGVNFCTETSLGDQNDIQHAANPEGHRYRVDNCYIDNNLDYSIAPTSRRSSAEGTMEDMALSMQSNHYFAIYAICERSSVDRKCAAWAREVLRSMAPHAVGSYLGDADFQEKLTKFWADPNAGRLMEVRRKWDADGVVAGYLDAGDGSGTSGLSNEHDWESNMKI